jgi:hypothetical protein
MVIITEAITGIITDITIRITGTSITITSMDIAVTIIQNMERLFGDLLVNQE